jgi:beta-lactamase regulating signal transducer with metallopeptidase domain
MIRFLLRTLGLLFLASAFIFLVYDGTRSIAANLLVYSKADEVWSLVHAASLQQLQPWIEQHAPRWLYDPVMTTILGAPAAVVLGIAGAILILLGRRKKKLIGYGR